MVASFLITFREGLEAAVIVGILLSTLRILNEHKRGIFIWMGTGLGIVMSFLLAWAFEVFWGGFTGTREKVYEGILMIFAFGVITHMVLWLHRYGRQIRATLENKVKKALQHKEIWALASLAFVAVVREGIETVIFLKAINVQSEGTVSLWGGFLGLLAAVTLAALIFTGTRNISPKRFFQSTGFLLVFIAAGLLAHSVVEFQSAEIIPIIKKPLFDLSAVLSEQQGLGAFLKALFGYDANPSLLAVIAYFTYLGGIFFYMKKSKR
jgi:high-affinity iron transporter